MHYVLTSILFLEVWHLLLQNMILYVWSVRDVFKVLHFKHDIQNPRDLTYGSHSPRHGLVSVTDLRLR